MRAAVIERPFELRLDETADPDPAHGEVVIKLEGSGICGSDVPVWEGRPWFQYPLPAGKPGHEGWGRIAALGHGVPHLKVGQRVASLACDTYAEFVTTPADAVVPLPTFLDSHPFPGEPLACAMNSFHRCQILPGDNVAVVGGGFQGLLLAQLAARAGADVVVLSRRTKALEWATAMGARKAIQVNGEPENAIAEALKGICSGGFDVVLEATGHQEPLELAAKLVRVRGRLIIVGYHQESRSVNMQLWNWRGIDVINAHERDPNFYTQGMRDAIAAIEDDRLEPWPLFTHTFALTDLAEGLNSVRECTDGLCKALVMA